MMADKNLRLDSRFSVIGAFWLPETPDSVETGTIVSDEDKITFTTAPRYERQTLSGSSLLSLPDTKMIRAFHGFTENGVCTLCQLVEGIGPNHTNFSLQQSVKARSYRVLSCVEGM